MRCGIDDIEEKYRNMNWHRIYLVFISLLIPLLLTTTISMNSSWTYVVISSVVLNTGHVIGSFIIGPVSVLSFYFHEELTPSEIYVASYLLLFSWTQVILLVFLPRLHAFVAKNNLALNLFSLGTSGYPFIKEFIIALFLISLPFGIVDLCVTEMIYDGSFELINIPLSSDAGFSDIFGTWRIK